MLDLDQYYTPDEVATDLVANLGFGIPKVFADSACGEGSLLRAASRAFKTVTCIGVDKDRGAIRRLRRLHPDWHLSVADILDPGTTGFPRSGLSSPQCDVLLLNPPFSLRSTKFVLASWRGELISCSVAMAHVLRSIDLFAPSLGIAAIVPESMLFSQTDDRARSKLASQFSIETVATLKNCTFRGARANATVVRFKQLEHALSGDSSMGASRRSKVRLLLVRGGLPVFQAQTSEWGIPFLHTTDIADAAKAGWTSTARRVAGIGRGQVAGVVVLIPRVGVPRRDSIAPILLGSTMQLSDCVIALKCGSWTDANTLTRILRTRWIEFTSLYKGTGARYVTVRRLSAWLETVGVIAGI